MKALFTCSLAFLLCACTTPPPQNTSNKLTISYVTGQYRIGTDDGVRPAFSELYITLDFHFVLGVEDHGQPVRATGTVKPGPRNKDGYGPQWIDLEPDAAYSGLPIPHRLYVAKYDSYQVLATQPRPPHFWQGKQPADYVYFNDDTAEQTPTYFKDIPTKVPVT